MSEINLDEYEWIVVVTIFLSVFVGFYIGANDVPNAWSVVVASGTQGVRGINWKTNRTVMFGWVATMLFACLFSGLLAALMSHTPMTKLLIQKAFPNATL
jgi:phosphate/sulfate permease